MDIENRGTEARGANKHLTAQNPRIDSENSEIEVKKQEVPSICLSPEQIEEIHSDEYSLTLFYATRVEPLSIADIKKQLPEPEPKKAQTILDRFVRVGLIHITRDGRYYSNFPENYINYAEYRYDKDLEAIKDSKVFSLMKQFTSKKNYWADKSYFSIDAFYSEDQTKEMQEMFRQIKLKAKEYANENAKNKSIEGLNFRRIKFYDMMFSILLVFALFSGALNSSFARGNDPTISKAYQEWISSYISIKRLRSGGGGNDPTANPLSTSNSTRIKLAGFNFSNADADLGEKDLSANDLNTNTPKDDPPSSMPTTNGGGGHDPGGGETKTICWIPDLNGQPTDVRSEDICEAQAMVFELHNCLQTNLNCEDIESELYDLLSQQSGQ